jgi:catechol 2,3-dioxygenase-like lactoylglutathione lyase family enzyme
VLDHLGISVRDFAASKTFYLKALAPIDIGLVLELTPEQTGTRSAAGFGSGGKPYFWFGSGGDADTTMHLAFATDTRAKVDAFYAAALSAGAKDNGAPGVRPHYHEHYYGAFVIDLNGINLEAVCHRPE